MGLVCVYSVAVLESASGRVASRLRGFDASIMVTRGERLDAFAGTYDLFLVVSADVFCAPPPRTLRCRALLVPGGGQVDTVLQIPSQWVVSFGLSGKDSITVSSLEPDYAVLALQRELVTLDGRVVEQQEIPLPIPRATGASGLMALYGALLLLGASPETLGASNAYIV